MNYRNLISILVMSVGLVYGQSRYWFCWGWRKTTCWVECNR